LIQINGQVDFTEDQLAVARHGRDGRVLAGEEGDGIAPVAEQRLPVPIERLAFNNVCLDIQRGALPAPGVICSVPAWRTLQGHGMGQVRGQNVAEQARAQRMGQAIHDVLQEIYAGNVRRARRRVVQVQAPVALQGRGQQAAQRPRQDGPKCPWR
jgi:hypothetical protein